jgi:DNA-binding SARP family transcriptional activator
MTDQLTIYFFGVPKILIEGRGAERQPAHKGMLLLAILTTNRGRPMDRTALAYDLWGDVPESRARRNLNTEIWRLRQIMGEAILSETTTVSFSPVEKCRIDIEEFETVDDSSGIESLEAALAVYQGEFLSGYYEDWAVVRREYYQDRYIQYLDRAARLYQSSSTTQKAVEAMKVILQYNPIHEESHQRLMRFNPEP